MGVALNASVGNEVWEFFPQPGVWNFLPLFPLDGTMVFQTWNGAAYRVNMSSGKEIWRSGPTDGTLFTDGGPAMGPNGMFYTVSHEGTMGQVHDEPKKPGMLRSYRISDGGLHWEKAVEQGIFTYPVVGVLNEGAPLSVVVGVGSLAGMPVKLILLMHLANAAKHPFFWMAVLFWFSLLFAGFRKYRPGGLRFDVCKSGLGALLLAAVGAQLQFQYYVGLWKPYIAPGVPTFASARYTYSVQAFEADTGKPQWRADLPPWNWYSAAGDEEGLFTRLRLFQRPIALPSASNYPTLDSQGIYYQGYLDGNFYSIKDWNMDGMIDNETEICSFNMGTCAFTAGPAIAPGMLATVSSDGLFVFGS